MLYNIYIIQKTTEKPRNLLNILMREQGGPSPRLSPAPTPHRTLRATKTAVPGPRPVVNCR